MPIACHLNIVTQVQSNHISTGCLRIPGLQGITRTTRPPTSWRNPACDVLKKSPVT